MFAAPINVFNSWLKTTALYILIKPSVTRLWWRNWKIRHIIKRAWSDTSAGTRWF
jgi:hypothetical protein